MSEKKIDEYGKKLLKYPNVVGYAKTLQKRLRRKKEVDEWCIQIHVKEKIPEKALRIQDIIPKTVGGIPTDIVVYGDLKIPLPPKPKVSVKKKTDKIRPLVAGISIGNLSITAGTLGWFMKKTKSPDKGEVFLASNAHVFCDEPKNKTSKEKRIVQPGRYDNGTEVVAEYYWHKRLSPIGESTCNVAKGVTTILNLFSKLLGRKTRFMPVVQEANHIDFAVARSISDWKPLFFDVDFPPEKFKFAGFGFAGSDTVSIVCKQKYIVQEGYHPLSYEVTDVSKGNVIHKTGRTSCHSQAKVILESAYEIVSYGTYQVAFDDVFVTEKLLEPGDSGSSAWLSET